MYFTLCTAASGPQRICKLPLKWGDELCRDPLTSQMFFINVLESLDHSQRVGVVSGVQATQTTNLHDLDSDNVVTAVSALHLFQFFTALHEHLLPSAPSPLRMEGERIVSAVSPLNAVWTSHS